MRVAVLMEGMCKPACTITEYTAVKASTCRWHRAKSETGCERERERERERKLGEREESYLCGRAGMLRLKSVAGGTVSG